MGAGWFGEFCLRAYAELPEVEVVAVADADFARARAIAPPGAAAHRDLASVLAADRVAIVHVATPPASHAPITLQALAAGRHVFVEKPLALSLEDATRVADDAALRGWRVGIDYVLRHHPLHQLALRLTSSGVLGEAITWSLENFAAADRLPADHWFWDPSRSGGIHVEHGVHFFDICQQVAGSDRPSSVMGWSQHADGRVDRVGATVLYGERLAATFSHAFVRSDRFERTSIRIGLRRGQIVLDGWIPTELRVWGAASEADVRMLRRELGATLRVGSPVDEPFLGRSEDGSGGKLMEVSAVVARSDRWAEYAAGVRAGMRELVRAIRGGPEPTVSMNDALVSLETALRASG